MAAALSEPMGPGDSRQALRDALKRICARGQNLFNNPLCVEESTDPDTERPVRDPILAIIEMVTTRRFCIPRKERRALFFIDSGFWGGAYGKKEVVCTLLEPSLRDIVVDEVQRYADAHQATAVTLTTDFR